MSLRIEGGTNFHVGGKVGKWILWTVVFLTVPQILSWVAVQGITVSLASGLATTACVIRRIAQQASSNGAFVQNLPVRDRAVTLTA